MAHVVLLFMDQLIAVERGYVIVRDRVVAHAFMGHGRYALFFQYAIEQCLALVRVLEPGAEFPGERRD